MTVRIPGCGNEAKVFILLEVLLAVVIMSGSLVLVIHSLMISARAAVLSQRYAAASLALENSIFGLMVAESDLSQTDDEPQGLEYERQIESGPSSLLEVGGATGLKEVTVAVRWSESGKSKQVSAETLLLSGEEQ